MTSNKKKVWLIIWIFFTAVSCPGAGKYPPIRLGPYRILLNQPERFIHYSEEDNDSDKVLQVNEPSKNIKEKLLQNEFVANVLRDSTPISKMNGLLHCWSDPQFLKMIFPNHFGNKEEIKQPTQTKEHPAVSISLFNDGEYKQLNGNSLTDDELLQLLDVIDSEDSINNQRTVGNYSSEKHEAGETIPSKEKNPTLMESIFNPFFLKIFKNNRKASQKKNINRMINNNLLSDVKSDKTCSDFNTKWPLLNKYIKHEQGSLSPVKDTSIKQDKVLPDSFGPKQSNQIDGIEDVFIINDKNKFIVKQVEDEPITEILKPIKLSGLAKNSPPFQSLLNETLLDFGLKMFNILQEFAKPAEEVKGRRLMIVFKNPQRKRLIKKHVVKVYHTDIIHNFNEMKAVKSDKPCSDLFHVTT